MTTTREELWNLKNLSLEYATIQVFDSDGKKKNDNRLENPLLPEKENWQANSAISKQQIETSSQIRKLQASLFPVQPLKNQGSDDMSPQNRLGFSKKDMINVPDFFKYRESLDTNEAPSNGINGVTQESARWPTECQVIADRIRHIGNSPTIPEPYYIPTGKEPRPKPVTQEYGIVIFDYYPLGVTNYFSRSCVGGNSISPEIQKSTDDSSQSCSTDLNFESRFESGNLGKVIKITDTYYQLHLRPDLYTQRHSQWYYFRISNTRSGTLYRLSIVNFCKDESLYNDGLKPLLYSTKDADLYAIGWRRCGENISYYKNNSDEEKERHTLTFNLNFPHDEDVVYLAHCYPYTYTDLQDYLSKLVNDPVKTRFTKLRLLCRSLAGNGVYYLTITEPNFNEGNKKKGIVVTARVHPGETPSSWIMKGIIDFLTGETSQAKELRRRFVFKLVPMLNPDGVIVGNNRCSLSGKDLNRQYRTVMRESYPSVWHTKLMIRRLMEECGIATYCDLHAHSRKHNIFIYGCENKRGGCNVKLSEQVFPLMLHKNAADKFAFESCKFHIEKGKEGTGRVVVWLMGIPNSYTMEASLGGSKLGCRSGTHFSTSDYEQIGKAFCETLIDFSDDDPAKVSFLKSFSKDKSMKEKLRNKIVMRLVKEGSSADEPTNINLTDYSSDEGDTSDSSSEKNTKIQLVPEDHNQIHSEPSYQTETLAKKKCKKVKKKFLGHKSVARKKLSVTRTTIDLPTAEPGNDLYDFSDSTEDNYFHYFNEVSQNAWEDGEKPNGKKVTQLLVPSPTKRRSFSAVENPRCGRSIYKNEDCSRRHLPKTMRNSSPMMMHSPKLKVKSTSLPTKIWTGIQVEKGKQNTKICPLSWGVSSMSFLDPAHKIFDKFAASKQTSNSSLSSPSKSQKQKTKITVEHSVEKKNHKLKKQQKQPKTQASTCSYFLVTTPNDSLSHFESKNLLRAKSEHKRYIRSKNFHSPKILQSQKLRKTEEEKKQTCVNKKRKNTSKSRIAKHEK